MLISSRGRYILRVLLDLAEHSGERYVPMREVAARQGISLKYIERIIPALSQSRYVEGVHGKGGGYRLARPPREYRVGDILRLAEGDLAPVACLGCEGKPCDRAEGCKTMPMWTEFLRLVNDYLDGITLEDLLNNGQSIE